MDGDLHLINSDNKKFDSTEILDKYLREKNIDVGNRLFNFEKLIKNLTNIDDKIKMIRDNYKFKTEDKYDDKKELLAF